MNEKRRVITRKIIHVGGWQVVRRVARMVPLGGAFVAAGLLGHDIKRKGVVKGIVNSGLDAIPGVGFVKNGIELFTGDFIRDKTDRNSGRR